MCGDILARADHGRHKTERRRSARVCRTLLRSCRKPDQLFPKASDTPMRRLVNKDVVGLIEPEQGRFGILSKLDIASIDKPEAVGEPVVLKPKSVFNLADAEGLEARRVSHRLLSSQFQ